MHLEEHAFYTLLRPEAGEEGARFVFDVRLSGLIDDEVISRAEAVRALGIPTWWPITLDAHGRDLVFGSAQPAPEEDEEAYMILPPGKAPRLHHIAEDIDSWRVRNEDMFALWATLANQALHGGYPVVHAGHHAHLWQEGQMDCWVANWRGQPAAVAATLRPGNGSVQLNFVGTLPHFRRRGLAQAVSQAALSQAVEDGADMVTLTASAQAKALYTGLGFEAVC